MLSGLTMFGLAQSSHAAPRAENFAAVQGMQPDFCAFGSFPGSQEAQVVRLSLTMASQVAQMVPNCEYLPSEQETQSVIAGLGSVPGLHGVQTLVPSPNVPAGHGVH